MKRNNYNENKIANQYDSKIILLSEVVKMVNKFNPEMDNKLHVALHVTLKTLSELYNLDNERWREIRDLFQVGFIKETKEYGNTSVSMGVAADKKLENGESIGLLNCGTGGIKYQLYRMENNMLNIVGEYKPNKGQSPGGKGQSPGNANVHQQKGKQLQFAIAQELLNVPWKGKYPTYLVAFITGPLRKKWEDSPKDEADGMEYLDHLGSSRIQRWADILCLKKKREDLN